MDGTVDHGAPWEHFAHEADDGVRGVVATKADAFGRAALVLTVIVADPGDVAAVEDVGLICEMAARKPDFGRYGVAIDATALAAHAIGKRRRRAPPSRRRAVGGNVHRPAGRAHRAAGVHQGLTPATT